MSESTFHYWGLLKKLNLLPQLVSGFDISSLAGRIFQVSLIKIY
jgi:hypothetical protein